MQEDNRIYTKVSYSELQKMDHLEKKEVMRMMNKNVLFRNFIDYNIEEDEYGDQKKEEEYSSSDDELPDFESLAESDKTKVIIEYDSTHREFCCGVENMEYTNPEFCLFCKKFCKQNQPHTKCFVCK